MPSFVAQTNFGPLRVNRWGMRDKDYDMQPPAQDVPHCFIGSIVDCGLGSKRWRDF